MTKSMTTQELAVRLKNMEWAIRFMLDNNPTAVLDNLRSLGLTVATKDQAFQAIKTIVLSGDKSKIGVVFSTPYNDAATNGTGGFADYFRANTLATPPSTGRFNWDGLFDFLGGGFSSLGNQGQTGTVTQVPKTPEQIAAEEAAKKAEEDAKRQQQIVTYIIFGVIVVVIIVVTAMILRGSKPKATA